MKTLTTNFNTQKNLIRGARPIYILKWTTADHTLFLSDKVVSVGDFDGSVAVVTKAWITNWGGIDESINTTEYATKVSDFSLTVVNGSVGFTTLENILWDNTDSIEESVATLYLWFIGLDADTDPPIKLFQGYAYQYIKKNTVEYSISFIDAFTKYNTSEVGNLLLKINNAVMLTKHSGEMIKIIYGTFTAIKALGRAVGKCAQLADSIDDVDTSFDVQDASELSNGTYWIENEQINITNITSNTITATRAYGGTTGATHASGITVRENKGNVTYLIADHAIKTINDIFVTPTSRGKNTFRLNITSICTKFTSTGGKALITFSAANFKTQMAANVNAIGVDYEDVEIYVGVEGYKDDGSGTFTGTANALITRPDHVIKHFTYTYSDISITNFTTTASTYFSTFSGINGGTYKFNVCIDKQINIRTMLSQMAFQCRCWYRLRAGVPALLLRTTSGTAVKTITQDAIVIDSIQIERSSLADVINFITFQYGSAKYQDTIGGDSEFLGGNNIYNFGSYIAYGVRSKIEKYDMGFCENLDMAQNVVDYYLSTLAYRKKKVKLSVFLDQCELEFYDKIKLQHVDYSLIHNVNFYIMKVNHKPAELKETDTIELELLEV